MNTLSYRAAHAIPAFMVGGLVWCVLAVVFSRLDYGVLGYFSAPGYPTWLILLTAAAAFFPLFFVLRWLKLLNMGTFAGGLALLTLALSSLGESSTTTRTALLVAMSAISGAVAFMVLRGGARAVLAPTPQAVGGVQSKESTAHRACRSAPLDCQDFGWHPRAGAGSAG